MGNYNGFSNLVLLALLEDACTLGKNKFNTIYALFFIVSSMQTHFLTHLQGNSIINFNLTCERESKYVSGIRWYVHSKLANWYLHRRGCTDSYSLNQCESIISSRVPSKIILLHILKLNFNWPLFWRLLSQVDAE